MLLLHYTGMQSAEAALQRLCDPSAKVSAHYLIDEAGGVHRLVADQHRAWHAGIAGWGGETDINSCAVGIELVNPGHEFGYRPFPQAQMLALLELATRLVATYAISPARILGHSDVAPLRKSDPGELFDWHWLATAGIGRWPDAVSLDSVSSDPTRRQSDGEAALREMGYMWNDTGDGGPESASTAVIRAFQRHWRPATVDGVMDRETAAIIQALVK